MSLPSSIGLPKELMLGSLDNSLPPDAKSFSVKVQPSNLSTVVGSFSTGTTSNVVLSDIPFPTQNIMFDLPCGTSPSMFLDNRFTTLNFNVTVECTDGGTGTGGTGSAIQSWGDSGAFQRSSGCAWFDRMYITGQSGNIIEDIGEFGLINDTLMALQMNDAVRKGVATQYGLDCVDTLNVNNVGCQGHKYESMYLTNPSTTETTEIHSYSIPLLSGVIGCTADKFLNVGRTSKLSVTLVTSKVLPITIPIGTNNISTSAFYKVTLSNFSLQCEYIDVGVNALQMLDSTLINGVAYIHGITYRTSMSSIDANTSGKVSSLAGIRASSVKSLFARFAQGGSASTSNSCNGKYDSTCPMLNSINYSICGLKYPQSSINPLYSPSQSYRETQCAIGSFNNAMYQSSISPKQYCKLSAGGLAQSFTNTTQAREWNLGTTAYTCAQYIFGVCLEIVAKRGLLSGLNCTSAPIFVEMNIANPVTNTHTLYIQAMLDHIVCHDCQSGDLQVRI